MDRAYGEFYQLDVEMSFVEQEERNPTLDTVLRMCDALEMDIEIVLKQAQREARE